MQGKSVFEDFVSEFKLKCLLTVKENQYQLGYFLALNKPLSLKYFFLWKSYYCQSDSFIFKKVVVLPFYIV